MHNTTVKGVFEVGKREDNKIVIAKVKTFEGKLEVMTNKLGRKKIYVENDLTVEKRRIQAIIKERAKDEKQRGKKTRVGYQKLNINGKEFRWGHAI